MEIKRIFLIILLAGKLYASGDAGREIAVLDLGYGARAMALGGAYTAHAPDASSLYWNPAAMAFAKRNDFSTMHAMLSTDVAYYNLGGIFPAGPGVWGWSWIQLQLSDIPQTSATLNNNEVEVLNELTYFENAGLLGWGQEILPGFSYGFNAKYLSKKISDNLGEARGYSGSLGIYWQVWEELSFGLVADNVVNSQVYDTGTIEQVPALYRAGLGFQVAPWLNVLIDGHKRADKESFMRGHIGLEFLLSKNFNFLLGYDYDRLTTGVGFLLNSVYVDYAYLADNQYSLGSEQFISLGVRW